MTLDNVIKVLLAGTSLCLGSYLTALRSKIITHKIKSNLHYAFYFVTGIFAISAIFSLIYYWNEIFYDNKIFKPDVLAIIIILSCLAASIALFVFTIRNLIGKYQYKTVELDPIVNKFTEKADKDNIRLLAGDINFFGNHPSEMEDNAQYSCLRRERFREIQILCWEPDTNSEKIRYGKLINDFPQVKLKYYKPPNADLKIRGRLKTFNNVTHLLIYNKIQPGIYEPLETDTANPNGAMYNHLWDLIWDSAKQPSQVDLEKYKELFKNSI